MEKVLSLTAIDSELKKWVKKYEKYINSSLIWSETEYWNKCIIVKRSF